jgi:hypothetical protein
MIKEDKKRNKKHEEKMKNGEGEKKMGRNPERKQGCIEVGKRKDDKGRRKR